MDNMHKNAKEQGSNDEEMVDIGITG